MKIIPIISNHETKPVQVAYMNTLAGDIMGVANMLEKAQELDVVHKAGRILHILSEQTENLLNTPLNLDRPHKKPMLFLASPFTSEDRFEQNANINTSISATRFLIKRGFNVYNPLAHGFSLLLGAEFDFVKDYMPYFNWHELNCRIMETCDALIWLDDPVKTPRSNGMLAEIKHATMLGLPILGMKRADMGDFVVYSKAGEKSSPFPITATIGD